MLANTFPIQSSITALPGRLHRWPLTADFQRAGADDENAPELQGVPALALVGTDPKC